MIPNCKQYSHSTSEQEVGGIVTKIVAFRERQEAQGREISPCVCLSLLKNSESLVFSKSACYCGNIFIHIFYSCLGKYTVIMQFPFSLYIYIFYVFAHVTLYVLDS